MHSTVTSATLVFLTTALYFQLGHFLVSVSVDDIKHDSAHIYWDITTDETDVFIEETEVTIKRLHDGVVTASHIFVKTDVNNTPVEELKERTNYIACVNVKVNVSNSALELYEDSGCSDEFSTLASLLWILSIASGSFLVLCFLCLGCIDLTSKTRKAAKVRRKEKELLTKTEEIS